MKMQVTGRHMRVTQETKEYAEEKSKRLEKYADKINWIKVIFSKGKNDSYSAEMIVSATGGAVLVCHGTEETLPAAIGTVMDRMERKLQKIKDKLRKKTVRRVRKPEPAPDSP